MVSRRNYFSITVIMFIIFFMFQFTNVALEQWNDFEENPYADHTNLPSGTGETSEKRDQEESENVVVYIGDAEENIGRMVQTWTAYTKRDIRLYDSLELFENERQEDKSFYPEMMLVDSKNIEWEQEIEVERFEKYVEQGINLIFCNLPDVTVIKDNSRIMNILGIQSVKQEETTVTGIHLYEGFLLGNEVLYYTDDEEESKKRQDMDLDFPWYELSTGAKVYMNAMFGDEWKEDEDHPSIIWRKNYKSTFVFAVNGNYMEDVTGLGILSAMASEMKEYEIYPVVNAQNMIVANYPGLALENNKEIKRRYGQSMREVFRNILWPGIIAVYQQNELGLSCMMTPQYDYTDKNEPDEEELTYYGRLLNEQSAELGLSGTRMSDTSIEEKLASDQDFMQKALSSYEFTSFYAGDLSEEETKTALNNDILKKAKTVVSKYDGTSDILGYLSRNITKQSTLTDGLKHTYSSDLRIRSVETALGYTSVLVDIADIAYPADNSDDTWTDVSGDFAWNIQNYWRDFHAFSGTTVSECDERIRNFFELEYTSERKGDYIYLNVEGLDAAGGTGWFILRDNNESIQDVTGGSWQRLGTDAYLIEVTEQNVTISLKPADGYHYMFE